MGFDDQTSGASLISVTMHIHGSLKTETVDQRSLKASALKTEKDGVSREAPYFLSVMTPSMSISPSSSSAGMMREPSSRKSSWVKRRESTPPGP